MIHNVAVRMALVCALGAALLGGAAAPARAQERQPTLAVNELDAKSYPDLRAVVTALDANGVPVPGLTTAQFQASDGATALTITGVTTALDGSLPLSVVITIDVSGSMAGESLDRAKQAATDFVRNLGPNDDAALVAFNNGVAAVVPFTNDKLRLTNGIANLQAAGGTALYEAVQTSAFSARSASSPRRAVVLLTDGKNDTADSAATSAGSLAAAQGAGVPVFTVAFGADPDVQYLQGLSASTQGQYRPATAATVGSVYTDLAALLRSQY